MQGFSERELLNLDLLDAREKREAFEQSLVKKSGMTLMTLRGNYPEQNKNLDVVSIVVDALREEVHRKFIIEKEYHWETKEGRIYFFLLEKDGRAAKRSAVDIEETHPLGRLVDLDVRDGYRMYSRKDLQLPERRCYLCDDKAVYCVRSQKHEIQEVIHHFEKLVKEYKEQETI